MTRQKEPFLRWLCRAALKGALLVALFPIVLPLALLVLTLYLMHRIALHLLVWALWLPRGKSVLFVYSESPIWQEYMATQILPLVQDRAVVLNWSERGRWPRWSFRVHVFRAFGGDYNFNPMVVLFRPFRSAKVFRFWSAFKDWKRGHPETVERLREELVSSL